MPNSKNSVSISFYQKNKNVWLITITCLLPITTVFFLALIPGGFKLIDAFAENLPFKLRILVPILIYLVPAWIILFCTGIPATKKFLVGFFLAILMGPAAFFLQIAFGLIRGGVYP